MSDRASLDLVVARHTENLLWLRRVPRDVRVFVYNKGSPVEPPRRGTLMHALPNVGREAHTYLHHLATSHADLADVTVFVQGHPFDHAPDLHRRLRAIAAGDETVADFRWFGFLVDEDDCAGSRLFQRWSKNPEGRPLDLRSFWTRVFGSAPCPASFVFFGGANFAVRAAAARSRSASFYARAAEVAAEFPDAAHCFERVWDHVFGVQGLPPELRGKPTPIYLKPIRRLMA